MFRLIFLISLTLSITHVSADEWHTFTSQNGQSFVGKVVSKDNNGATIERKNDGKVFTVSFDKLSADDVKYVKAWTQSATPAATVSFSGEANVPKDLFPHSRKEIAQKLREISNIPAPAWATEAQKKALARLNQYRFLCGVNSPLTLNADANSHAEKATAVIEENFPNISSPEIQSVLKNLLFINGGTIETLPQNVMRCFGSASRSTRHLRHYILDPTLKEIGIANAGKYCGAMRHLWGRKGKEKIWSYPGKGFFPASYFHGNAWSVHTGKDLDKEDQLEVFVYRLDELPKKKPKRRQIKGKQMEVVFTAVFSGSVIFEPIDPETNEVLNKPGIYAVFIDGAGMKTQYVVALY